MKKKIALLLAAVMTVGSLPMTAFASTDNYVSSIKTVEDGDDIDATVFVEEFKGISGTEKQTVKLTLTNAKFRDTQEAAATTAAITVKDLTAEDYYKWNSSAYEDGSEEDYSIMVGSYNGVKYLTDGSDVYDMYADFETDIAGDSEITLSSETSTTTDTKQTNVAYTKISDTVYMAEFDANSNSSIQLDIDAEADGSGDATVTIEAVDSVVSSQTLKIATIAGGATTTTISGTTSIKETPTEIKSIVITETTAGSIDKDGVIKLKLSNGFTWSEDANTEVVVFPSTDLDFDASPSGTYTDTQTGNGFVIDADDDSVAYIVLSGESKTAATISLQGALVQYDEDDVEVGDECEVTVSDAGTTKQSIVIGTASDYGVSFSVEDKDLPTFYAGRYDDDVETLVVTVKENIENSWLTSRKTKIVFPEGVEVMAVNVDDSENISNASASSFYSIDENEVTLNPTYDGSGKMEADLKFELSVAADFTGDITATLTGSAVGDDQEATVATAAFPVTVDADVNELVIDYRNTAASDIVITEAEAGALEKGKTVSLYIDGIDFDGDPTVEVESGDMKIENVKVSKGTLTFDIKTASQKEAAVIRISDIELYMERSLPAGEYDLMINAVGDAYSKSESGTVTLFGTNDAIIQNFSDTDDVTGLFDVDEVTAKEGYVTVVTAGRDQGDETFTTTVTVTIGADKMYAGTKEIALDVPAYISNGYTMLPVRAVTEALSGSAIVRWDDATKTVTITFGQRVISMTVGSNVMVINGVEVAMQAACEITDSRAFIPLRDLGYALGLNDSKIGWDDATKTATLN